MRLFYKTQEGTGEQKIIRVQNLITIKSMSIRNTIECLKFKLRFKLKMGCL